MNRLHLHRLLVVLILSCAALPATGQETFRKVLFLGNSITKHGPKADIDWSGNWGMAASTEAKDYVHLVVAGLAAKGGTAPETMVRNIADFERAHAGYDIAGKLREAVDFQADLIILAIGENVAALQTPEEQAAFRESVTKLLTVAEGRAGNRCCSCAVASGKTRPRIRHSSRRARPRAGGL